MITTYDICKSLLEAIDEYGPLKYFCLHKFEKRPNLFFGIDEGKPPTNDETPFIVLYQGDIEHNEAQGVKRNIIIGCAILDKDQDETTSRHSLYGGYRTAEKMLRLAYRAIEKYCNESERDLSIIGEGSTSIKPFHPYYHGVRTVEIITAR